MKLIQKDNILHFSKIKIRKLFQKTIAYILTLMMVVSLCTPSTLFAQTGVPTLCMDSETQEDTPQILSTPEIESDPALEFAPEVQNEPENPVEATPISGTISEPGAITIGTLYQIDPFFQYDMQCFTFSITATDKPYTVVYTPSAGVHMSLSFGTQSGDSFSYLKNDKDGSLYYTFTESGTYALLLQNNGTDGSVTFSVQEAEGPPAVAVDGIITPSTTPGTTGGLSLNIAEGDSNVKVFSFEAEAGKRYSAVIYKISGGEYASLDCSFSDAYGAGEVAWGGGTFGLEIEGLPSDIYEAGTTGTHYLNVRSWSGDVESYVIKIYSNTPAAPVLSPDFLPENTTMPTEITITSVDSAELYYYYATTDDTRYSYSGPFELDIETMLVAYAAKDGIYSETAVGWYWFSDTKYPSFSPTGYIQPQGTIISITGAEEGDIVYYTTDGTNPYNSSTRQAYTEPSSISVGSDGLELQAIIKNSNGVYGNTAYNKITRGTVPPYISNIPGEGSNPGATGDTFDAILASAPGASIYYTLDGTEATADSTLYTVPIPINSNTRIRAIAIQGGIVSTELNQFLNITEPRTINVGETVQGMSYGTYPEWFTFTISDTGTYNFTVTPENEEHGFIYYSDWWSGTYNDPVVLYDSDGVQLHRFVSGSGESISDPSVMKYNFTNSGTYRLSVSSKASQDERFSLQIDQGIKPPVPNIPVDSYSSMAYIKEG
ncbi:MAG: chitobiase/beta-hexosaminidase C-terminal domain-containing protein, partial [Eubacteriales bacterium]|nr:chitobiase/beta-hexosaminidase C-terminal domain-containing protein [Eubacteriales bacterium]